MENTWVLFRVLDRENEPSSFQEMLTNTTKYCLKLLQILKKRIPVRITSVLTHVNVSYYLRFGRL